MNRKHPRNPDHSSANDTSTTWRDIDPRFWAGLLVIALVAALAGEAGGSIPGWGGALAGILFAALAAVATGWLLNYKFGFGLTIDEEEIVRAARLKSALDSCLTNVMVADADYNIVYVNDTLREMLARNEADLRQELRQFDAANIVGCNMDMFHKNPAHQRALLGNLHGAHEAHLIVSELHFNLVASPIIDNAGERIGTVIEWADVTAEKVREEEEKRIATEQLRLKSALDSCLTNVMVADADYNIVYVNDTLREMLARNEADLRQELRQFDAANIVGCNMDMFHKNPAHQRALLGNLHGAHEAQLNVAELHFNLVASPIINDQGERIGTVVEWADVTAEKTVEAEVDAVVAKVAVGNFNTRIDCEGKTGFMRNLAESVNNLCQTIESAIDDVAATLSTVSGGDLTCRIEKNYAGSFEKLKIDVNSSTERLAGIVSDIMAASNEVSNAAAEIAQGTEDLSQRTERQASSLQETAASMEEVSATVKQNAENAQQAKQLSLKASDVADKGGAVVNNAVKAMGNIEESSRKVSDIIGVIDEIAFQTNLLALNAAVEAARAGDAGKGFAVVASEVRTLAQRSSQAAKDIKSLIVESCNQVNEGVGLVNQTGESLSEIEDSIKRLGDIVAEIAAASSEQATGIEEINGAIAEMDNVTQQNSALVEESAAAAQTLREQSSGMQQHMSFFTIADTGAAVAAAGRKARTDFEEKTRASQMAAGKSNNGATAPALARTGTDDDWSEF